jgi:hypothetical protein
MTNGKSKTAYRPLRESSGGARTIARVLADAKVNILGFLTGTSGAEGWVQLVVDKPERAKKALDREGLPYTEEAVLHVELRNVPGVLASFTEKLADKDINITAGYQTAVKDSRKASVVLAVSDLDTAARVR